MSELRLSFSEEDPAQAAVKTKRLREHLQAEFPDVELSLVKADPTTQDVGSILAIILASTSAVALAGGVADFLRKERATITITRTNGEVVAKGLKSEDAARIAEAFVRQ